MNDKVTNLLKQYDKAKVSRDSLCSLWRDISDYVRPVKQRIGETLDNNYTPRNFADIYDTTAIDANRTYAAGCMSWMTPSETTWFGFSPPRYLDGDDSAKSWYSECTDITREILAETNFYSTIHECYLDDGAFGTCGLIVEEAEKKVIRFEALQIGTYAILENHEREVDQVFREIQLTARQAAAKFGEANLHRNIAETLPNAGDKKWTFLHILMPREDSERVPGKIDAENMPWASIYIDLFNKTIVRESGSWELPAIVHRHALWSHLPWGWSPAMQALADCKQLNYMQQYLDALVEKQVSPPTMSTGGFEGKIDQRAGGHTYYKDEESKPTYWPNPGNYMIGEDRVEFRQRQIDRAFYVDLFQAMSRQRSSKVMTAAEVYALKEEILPNFSPTFARKNSEVNDPVIRRVFALLLRGGYFPEPPNGLVQQGPDGLPFLPDPDIKYTSRMAIALDLLHNKAFERSFEKLAAISEFNPGALDHVNFDSAVRNLLRIEGVEESSIRPEREVEEIRSARAQQAQQMQEQEAAAQQADNMSKMAKAG